MKNQINAVKIGKTVNIWIDGKLRKKVCDTNETADELFKLVLSVKANPTEEGIKKVFGFLNEKTRIAMKCGLETDPDTGEVYLAGFNTPVPMDLVEVIKEYHENGYPMEAILNFWRLLMLNPDKTVRTTLFDFIKTHDFVLTDNGYMVVYKAVDYNKNKQHDTTLSEFITNRYLHVKKEWKTSARRYVVYRDLDTDKLHITKTTTAENWDLEQKNVEILGNLNEMFENLEEYSVYEEAPYTDMYSNTMQISLGETVHMPRTNCDNDPSNECSYGLHVGATRYVEWFGSHGDVVLVCYVNPAHVVAVPQYDNSKIRVSQYFPFAVATYENGQIDMIEQKYFESDYTEYEVNELTEMIAKVQEEELPIETDEDEEEQEETRSMEELQRIIENRIITITE